MAKLELKYAIFVFKKGDIEYHCVFNPATKHWIIKESKDGKIKIIGEWTFKHRNAGNKSRALILLRRSLKSMPK